MHEKLSRSQEKTAIRASESIEDAWRVVSHFDNHSRQEIKEALRYLHGQKQNIEYSIQYDIGGIDPEVYEKVFMGIYHHGIDLPPELKYKDPKRN